MKRVASSSGLVERKPWFTAMKPVVVVSVCLMTLSALIVVVLLVYPNPSLDHLKEFAPTAKPVDVQKDKLLGGLLSPGFDESSCVSRYESGVYRRSSPYKSSSYLQSRLRKYEDLHKRCGPHTEAYKRSFEKFKSGHSFPTGTEEDCNYIVWISYCGLGNRMITMASAFLYALLTNRVLLVERDNGRTDDLFCEPFPETSWLLPPEFDSNKFQRFDQKSPQSYGNMLKRNLINSTMESPSLPPYFYLHITHDYDHHDALFFCDQDQSIIQKVPWLIMKSNIYFVPSLFMMESFQPELNKLFPSKDQVFHHLGRYLFHPRNAVWGLITRYFEAYLANADERVGIQIRDVFYTKGRQPFKYVYDQIVDCILNENLLPEANHNEPLIPTPSGYRRKSKAVLVTSLNAGYLDMFRKKYWQSPTVTGELIAFYQPSHEEYQQTEKIAHNRIALAEMYLLSLTDVLITSPYSTFGYVAQGLGGLRPWILYKPENHTAPNPPCRRTMSMEPCFLNPPYYDCKAKTSIDTGAIVPYVRHCEDKKFGVKLVERDEL